MGTTVIVGGQWGDEGKAKVVDALSEDMNMVVRYQGGANAGHTVAALGKTYVFHLIPSGILYPNIQCVLGNGVVIDPAAFADEIKSAAAQGISAEGRLFVSKRAHVVMPYHKLLDNLKEKHTNEKIGTTKRGIGFAYADKVSRVGLRVVDILSESLLKEKLTEVLEWKNFLITEYYKEKPISFDEAYQTCLEYRGLLLPYVDDTAIRINQALKDGKNVLFEGAQGVGLDIDFGTYPYVTSSNPFSAGACSGSGISPRAIDSIIGIFKAYATRVGSGPFPTRIGGDEEEALRKSGNEFGATTGRPRACGWFDGVQAKFSAMVNGFTGIALTKLDVLTGMKSIKIGVGYKIDGKIIENFPAECEILENAEVIYEEMKGWEEDISNAKSFDELPKGAQNYVKRIEEILETKVTFLSVGPNRDQTIYR